jgi:hypothetical protein
MDTMKFKIVSKDINITEISVTNDLRNTITVYPEYHREYLKNSPVFTIIKKQALDFRRQGHKINISYIIS